MDDDLTSGERLFAFDLNENKIVIGTDEAGRGCGAGGVFASAVCFHKKSDELIKQLADLNDSKKVLKHKRELLFDIIKENTINSTVCIDVDEIERLNILKASLVAMKTVCSDVVEQLLNYNKNLSKDDLIVLIDGNKRIWNFDYPQKYILKGDSMSASIAAASILAKVSRDRYMEKLDAEFPQYNWINNEGYLTKEHIAAIDEYGLCKYHRPSYLEKHFAKKEQLSLF